MSPSKPPTVQTRLPGTKHHVLFICTANLERSPTAEALFKPWHGLETLSAGTSRHAQCLISKELLEWADQIFVMEDYHQIEIETQFPALRSEFLPKMVVLRIPDFYIRGDPTLIQILREKVIPLLPKSIKTLNKEKY